MFIERSLEVVDVLLSTSGILLSTAPLWNESKNNLIILIGLILFYKKIVRKGQLPVNSTLPFKYSSNKTYILQIYIAVNSVNYMTSS